MTIYDNSEGDLALSASPRQNRKSIATVRVFILQAIIQNLAEDRQKLNALLADHKLAGPSLGDPNARLDLDRYLAFFEEAAVVFRDPVLGARIGQALRPGDFWPIGILLMQAGSIASALGFIARYSHASQTAASFFVHGSAEGLICGYRVHSDIQPRDLLVQDTEFTLSCICSQLRSAFDGNWHPLEVHFEHEAGNRQAQLEEIFGAPVRFSQTRNCIVVDPEAANKKYRDEDQGLINALNQHMASLIATDKGETPVREQIRALISVRLGNAPVELADLAREMGLTPRSLQRRLSSEGASLRDILQEYRKQLATAYLAQPHMSVEDISAAMGYAEPAVFSRAFKSWTGVSPTRVAGSGRAR